MNELVKYPSSPIAYDGWVIIGATAFLTVLFGLLFALNQHNGGLRALLGVLGATSLAAVLFSVWFFRDPVRLPSDQAPGTVISAADGRVLRVEHVNDPRYGAPAEKISIFMSPFNVHVNRSPVAGTVEKVEYVPGKFLVASLDKASTDNERNLVIVKTDRGDRVAFLQIAGLVARRIVCRAQPGDRLAIGQRYGMIRFGSRMEMFLPAGSRIAVKPGDRVFAGETVVGRLAGY